VWRGVGDMRAWWEECRDWGMGVGSWQKIVGMLGENVE